LLLAPFFPYSFGRGGIVGGAPPIAGAEWGRGKKWTLAFIC
jgi:hypothetical protein